MGAEAVPVGKGAGMTMLATAGRGGAVTRCEWSPLTLTLLWPLWLLW